MLLCASTHLASEHDTAWVAASRCGGRAMQQAHNATKVSRARARVRAPRASVPARMHIPAMRRLRVILHAARVRVAVEAPDRRLQRLAAAAAVAELELRARRRRRAQ